MKKLVKTGLPILLVLFAVGLLLNRALAAPVGNYDPALGTGTRWDVVVSTDHYDDCWWENVFAGSRGWSDDVYVLTWPGGGLEIHAYDGFWYGDFYSVWLVNTATDTVLWRLFTTPMVQTGPQHVCATNPLHTGLGSTYSDGTFFWWFPGGTYEFKVRNEFFHVLAAEGIDPRTPLPWSPSGFYIGFHSAPHVVPEVPLGTVMTGAAMIIALVAYIGIRPKRRL